jgi:MarR family transcriptional regulator, organic hydroperoxide resistance regulator
MTKRAKRPVARQTRSAGMPKQVKPNDTALALEDSLGYQIRVTHRAIQRLLQAKIAPYGVKLGMWYFLRQLWDKDGLTQRELSQRIGTKEPTTLHAIALMERSGLVSRRRNVSDRRKMHVFLTRKGRQLEEKLLPLAIDVVDTAVSGFAARDVSQMLRYLAAMQENLGASLTELDELDE